MVTDLERLAIAVLEAPAIETFYQGEYRWVCPFCDKPRVQHAYNCVVQLAERVINGNS